MLALGRRLFVYGLRATVCGGAASLVGLVMALSTGFWWPLWLALTVTVVGLLSYFGGVTMTQAAAYSAAAQTMEAVQRQRAQASRKA